VRALLINSCPESSSGTNPSSIYPPLGLLYISSVAKMAGKEVRVIDLNAIESGADYVHEYIDKYNPDVIGISANVLTAQPAVELAKSIRKAFPAKALIAGGPMPTVLPELFLDCFDAVVRNEGEIAFNRILNGEPYENIDGISYKKSVTVNNRPAELIADLNKLPFPAYDLLEPSLVRYRSRARALPSAPILTSRGCPYRCTFCNKSIFGYKFRARSPANVFAEIMHLVQEFSVKQIDILDDNFTLDIQRAEEILDLIIDKRLGLFINLQNGICANRVDEKIIRKMKKAGVYKVGIGIESGSYSVLENIKKDINLDQVKEIIKAFRREGIIVYGFFMLGLPGDTPETMNETINFAVESDPHIADFSMTIPFPGTELYAWVKKSGRMNIDNMLGYDNGFFSGRTYFETAETRSSDVERYFSLAYRRFYFRPGKIYDILRTIKSFNELKWTIESAFSVALGK